MKTMKISIFLFLYATGAIQASFSHPELLPRFAQVYDEKNQPTRQQLPAGTLDKSFVSGAGYVVPNNIAGTSDNNFNGVAIDQQGRIVVGGSVMIGGVSNFLVTRFLSDGSIDRSFGTNGSLIYNMSPGFDSAANGILIDAQNGIIAIGTAHSDFALQRFLSNGTRDQDFAGGHGETNGGANNANAATIDSLGNIVLVGSTATGNNFLIVRYNSFGEFDTTFGQGLGYFAYNVGGTDIAYAVAADASNNLFVGGGTGTSLAVVKVKSDGSGVDTTFGTSGKYTHAAFNNQNFAIVFSILVDPQGKILVGGVSDGNFLLLRLTPLGVLDTTFGGGAGYEVYTFGSLDSGTAFEGHAIAIDPLGRIVMMGSQGDPVTGDGDFVVARALSDGTLDTTFGTGGYTYTELNPDDSEVFGGTLDSQGKIVVVGTTATSTRSAIVRYTTDYSFDYYKAQFAMQPLGLLA